MANGRNTIVRRGHNGGPYPGHGTSHRVTSTAHNTKPRLSSKEGIEARAEHRIATVPKTQPPGARPNQYKYHKPGSQNPRKVGR